MSKTDMPLNIDAASPAAKLDADNYAAEDLDGVTESLFGSGNLNYLTLQSQQNDLAAQNAAAGESASQEVSLSNLASGIASGHAAAGLAAGNADLTPTAFQNDDSASIGEYSNFTPQGISALNPSLANGGVGGISNSQSSSSSDSVFATSSSSHTDTSRTQTATNGTDGNNGNSGTDGANGSNGNDGQNGQDGKDGGGGGGGDDDNDVDIHLDTDIIGPINLNPVIDVILDPIEDIVGDIDVIVNTDLNLDSVIDTVTDTLNNPLDIVNGVLNGVDGLINSLLPQPTNGDTDLHVDLGLSGPINANPIVDAILDPVESIVGDIDINILPDLNLNDGAINLDIDALVANLPVIDTGVHLELPVLEAVGDTLQDLPGLDDILQDPAGTVQDLLGNTQNIVENLLGGGGGEGADDMDLQADLGIVPPIDVNLDVVESIVGDIDLDLTNQLDLQDLPQTIEEITDNVTGLVEDLATGNPLDLLDNLGQGLDDTNSLGSVANGVLDVAEELTEGGELEDLLGDGNLLNTLPDIANSDGLTGLLGGGPDNGDAVDDTDLVIDPSLNILGIETPDIEVAAVLDPVESILGDIDINIDTAIDALNGGGVGDLLSISGESTGTGEGGIWPENPVNGLVDTVFDSVLGGGDAAAGALPDPVGTVAEGLGILNLADTGSSSGGGHHGLLGGLFG